ncbi:MAG: hypothetical protein OXI59_19165 [Gemmatimonadota bacterium]|nr:hypothetical protein [Gemmatimonadota bacterium]
MTGKMKNPFNIRVPRDLVEQARIALVTGKPELEGISLARTVIICLRLFIQQAESAEKWK